MSGNVINWPDLYFGPINLYTIPRATIPHAYLELERKYCKEVAKELLVEKREKFNKLWNQRVGIQ